MHALYAEKQYLVMRAWRLLEVLPKWRYSCAKGILDAFGVVHTLILVQCKAFYMHARIIY
jgi:hypothetical protein